MNPLLEPFLFIFVNLFCIYIHFKRNLLVNQTP